MARKEWYINVAATIGHNLYKHAVSSDFREWRYMTTHAYHKHHDAARPERHLICATLPLEFQAFSLSTTRSLQTIIERLSKRTKTRKQKDRWRGLERDTITNDLIDLYGKTKDHFPRFVKHICALVEKSQAQGYELIRKLQTAYATAWNAYSEPEQIVQTLSHRLRQCTRPSELAAMAAYYAYVLEKEGVRSDVFPGNGTYTA